MSQTRLRRLVVWQPYEATGGHWLCYFGRHVGEDRALGQRQYGLQGDAAGKSLERNVLNTTGISAPAGDVASRSDEAGSRRLTRMSGPGLALRAGRLVHRST